MDFDTFWLCSRCDAVEEHRNKYQVDYASKRCFLKCLDDAQLSLAAEQIQIEAGLSRYDVLSLPLVDKENPVLVICPEWC